MKIAVFGRGKIGRSVAKLCSEMGFEVIGFSRTAGKSDCIEWVAIDYELDENNFMSSIEDVDVIVNCVGDVSLTGASRKLNVDFPMKLSSLANSLNKCFIHCGSTGYLSLFDGSHLKGSRVQLKKKVSDCLVDCINVYEEQKHATSELLRAADWDGACNIELLIPGFSEDIASAPWFRNFVFLQNLSPIRLAPKGSGVNLCFESTLRDALGSAFELISRPGYHSVLCSEFVSFDKIYEAAFKKRYSVSLSAKVWWLMYKIVGKRTRARIENFCNIVHLVQD